MYPRQRINARPARSFWVSAANFYVLAAAVALAAFFLAMWMLHDGGDDQPWVPAGIAASAVLIGKSPVTRFCGTATRPELAATGIWLPTERK